MLRYEKSEIMASKYSEKENINKTSHVRGKCSGIKIWHQNIFKDFLDGFCGTFDANHVRWPLLRTFKVVT